ncbi:MAG: peptidylprolyl isomerase [Paracoccaceae bacterium]|jgi:peptidyl-prolyl cis-trans isomerase SurA|nr:peptidylprolyl isomerase [Paracoccaceae bacterium]
MRIMSFVLLAAGFLAQPLMAQGIFTPVATVNDDIVTRFEVNQRTSMLDALGARGDLGEQALDGLIDDRLRVTAANHVGISASQEDISNAMGDFAQRNGQTLDGVLSMLANRGVAQETLRDFVTANYLWQTLVRQAYGAGTTVSEAEIDAALAATGESTNLQILVSEIVLPLIEGQEVEIRKLADDISKIRSQEEFSSAAKQFSVAGSRVDGGKLDWISLANLPPALRPVLLPLAVGEVSEPLELPNAVAMFQMRGLSETAPTSGSVSKVEYSLVTAPEGVISQLNVAADKALRCDDLYGLTSGIDGVEVSIQSDLPNDVPKRVSLWLARLDAGETIVDTSNDNQGRLQSNLVMLCSRTSSANKDASRDDVRIRLLNEKLNTRATSLLESLKASARINIR